MYQAKRTPVQQQAQYQAPSQPPAENNAPNPAPSQASTPSHNGGKQEYISRKIFKINATDKVVDFSSRLVPAQLNDFANVHGCGGADHASNSTIAITLCDYSKGKGEKSRTVSFNVDVEDMELLHAAAMSAALGTMQAPAKAGSLVQAADMSLNALRQALKLINGSANLEKDALLDKLTQIHKGLTDAGCALSNALNEAKAVPACPFEYTRQKNNPYKVDAQGYGPVSKLRIAYAPFREDGTASQYPWLIQIENCLAPIESKKNGANIHKAAQAINSTTLFIRVTTSDFCAAMVAVQRFVRLWEMNYGLPMMRQAYKKIEEMKENK